MHCNPARENPDTLKDLDEKIAMGFPGDAEDVADAVLFAASDMAKYITGTTIVMLKKISGGLKIFNNFHLDVTKGLGLLYR